jgi:flagellin
MIINHNISAQFANRQLSVRSTDAAAGMEKLSSGLRINKAADDASGLAVSEKMRSQIRGLNQAERNIQNGISFIQTSEGHLQETQDILHRLRELSVQSANGVYTSEDRMQIQVEVSQLVDEINRVASHAQFNGMGIFTGAFSRDKAGLNIQMGANVDQAEKIFVQTMTAQALGLKNSQGTNDSISLSSIESSNRAISGIDNALKVVSQQRADLGAFQNRFENAAKGISIAAENLQASESRIRDADMAGEMVNFVKNQILTQSSTAMLAQANTRTQSVLQLIG